MKAKKNSIMLFAAYGIVFIGSFVQLKLLALSLSEKVLGRYFFAGGIGLFAGGILQLGFPLLFQRYIPKFEHEKNRDMEFSLIISAILIHLSLFLVLFVPFYLFLCKSRAEAIIFAGFYLLSHNDLISTVFISKRKAEFVTVIKSVYYVLLIVLLVLLWPLNLNKVALALIVSAFPQIIISYAIVIKPARLKIKELYENVGPYFKFSMMTQILSPFFLYTDRLLIPYYISFGALSIFQMAKKLENGARNLLFIPLSAFAPEMSYLYETGNEIKSRQILKKLTLIYGIFGVMVFLTFLFFGKFLIILISSRTYISSYPHLVILGVAFMISLLYAPYTTYRRSRDGIQFFFKVNLYWVAAYIAFIVLTVSKLKLYSFSLGMVFASLIVLLESLKEYLQRRGHAANHD